MLTIVSLCEAEKREASDPEEVELLWIQLQLFSLAQYGGHLTAPCA